LRKVLQELAHHAITEDSVLPQQDFSKIDVLITEIFSLMITSQIFQ